MRHCIQLVCLLLLLSNAARVSAQIIKPRSFLYEAGLDGAPFLQGDQGASLILKYKFDAPEPGSWTRQNAMRLSLGFREEQIAPPRAQYFIRDSLLDRSIKGEKRRFFIQYGLERQFSYRFVRVYLGGDGGFERAVARTDNTIVISENGVEVDTDTYESEIRTHSFRVTPFAGIQLFAAPRLSIGLELGYPIQVNYNKTSIIRPGEPVFSDKSRDFSNGADGLLRLVYLSYHFGKMNSVQ